MDCLLTDIPHTFVYLDDILIGTPDVATYLATLRQVFGVLDFNGLTINFGKYDFLKEKITFLGHRVSTAGMTPLGNHVAAIRSVWRYSSYSPPENRRPLRLHGVQLGRSTDREGESLASGVSRVYLSPTTVPSLPL